MPKKPRGFEVIGDEQIKKDFKKFTIIDEPEIKIPKRKTALSAGHDVYTPFDIKLRPGEDINIPTGLKSYMKADEVLFAYPRSGIGLDYYVRFANTTPVIDADYYNNPKNEGHIFLKIRNESKRDLFIEKGDRFAQFVFQNYLLADGESFEGEERKGGFGHTDE